MGFLFFIFIVVFAVFWYTMNEKFRNLHQQLWRTSQKMDELKKKLTEIGNEVKKHEIPAVAVQKEEAVTPTPAVEELMKEKEEMVGQKSVVEEASFEGKCELPEQYAGAVADSQERIAVAAPQNMTEQIATEAAEPSLQEISSSLDGTSAVQDIIPQKPLESPVTPTVQNAETLVSSDTPAASALQETSSSLDGTSAIQETPPPIPLESPVMPTSQNAETLASSDTPAASAPQETSSSLDGTSTIQETPSTISIERPDAWIHQTTVSEEKAATLKTSYASYRKKKETDYEKLIGENLFSKIGILVLVIGIGFFVKYAIDQNWLGETARTILGFTCGLVLWGVAAKLNKKYTTFSSLLAGGGFAVFYVTVAIAFHYYSLFSQPVAFLLLVVLTIAMSAIAIFYNRRELAITAIVGGLIAPFLTSTGDGNYIALFSYLSILHLGMFGMALYKKWIELPVISFVATYFILFIYTVNSYEVMGGQPAGLLAFATLFYLLFALPLITIGQAAKGEESLSKVLYIAVMSNNFLYLIFGLYFASDIRALDSFQGVVPLFIALVNGGLFFYLRKKETTGGYVKELQLGLTVLFVTLIAPLQTGNEYTVLLCFAAESALLCWLYTKTSWKSFEWGAFLLFILNAFWVICALSGRPYNENYAYYFVPLWNSFFFSILFTGLSFGVASYVMKWNEEVFKPSKVLSFVPWCDTLLVMSVASVYLTFVSDFHRSLYGDESFWSVFLLFTLCAMLFVSVIWRKRFIYSYWFIGVACFLFLSWGNDVDERNVVIFLFPWLSALVYIALSVYATRKFFKACPKEAVKRKHFIIYLNVCSVLFWIAVVFLFLKSGGWKNQYNAGFSVALILAGLVQMIVGMRRHIKVLRIFSLVLFGIVLLKLVIYDLWLLPIIGRIIVFVLLGVILLTLSFLYQKLKDVLFDKK